MAWQAPNKVTREILNEAYEAALKTPTVIDSMTTLSEWKAPSVPRDVAERQLTEHAANVGTPWIAPGFAAKWDEFDNHNKIVIANHRGPNKLELRFECFECEAEFECGTTSFTKLCNEAKAAGWFIKWLDRGYWVGCPKCVKRGKFAGEYHV